MNAQPGSDAHAILGDIDALKFHSSMTLFTHVAGAGSVFHDALLKFFGGGLDPRTAAFLEAR